MRESPPLSPPPPRATSPSPSRAQAPGAAGGVDRLPHGAQHQAAGVRREQRGDVAFGKQGLGGRQPAARVAHGGLMESRGARVVSRGAGAGFGTGTVSTPWASAATAPFRLVASRTRIRYFLPGSSGCAAWTTSRSDGTRRCFKSWRIFVVSTRAALVSRTAGRSGGGGGGAGGWGGAPRARSVSRRAGVAPAPPPGAAAARALVLSDAVLAP